MTPAVWDHIFLDKPAPAECAIPADVLARMKREFEYWYPFDLRVSGKVGRPAARLALPLAQRAWQFRARSLIPAAPQLRDYWAGGRAAFGGVADAVGLWLRSSCCLSRRAHSASTALRTRVPCLHARTA